ncbi:MAG: hypothetical protein SNF33_00465 [Candidatus Algichlamydia australiensis]|nr:hypothetical protein [Chlamydiales bacterium]
MTSSSDRVRNCSYVVNIPFRVDSDSEESDSSDEEIDGTFQDECFTNPSNHFQLRQQKTLRGFLGEVLERSTPADPPVSVEKIEEISKIFKEENQNLNGSLLPRIKIVLGLNKMRSLSTSRNRSLQTYLDASNTSIPFEKIAFFWEGEWQRKKNGRWTKCSYDDARQFYKQLKNKSKKEAKAFREKIEEKRAHLVPIREIRDLIKNHPTTSNATRILRQKERCGEVFLLFLDGDLLSLRSQDSCGPFSIIDKYSQEASIISTGYTVRERENIPLELGVLADLVVREATARIFPNGVYYPEPCTAIKILESENTVTENFSDGTSRYASPQEMPRLILEVKIQRNLNPRWAMKFDALGSIITTTPPRMAKRGSFTCTANSNGQLKLIKWSDIQKMRNITQTHYHPLHWAKNLIPALELRERVALFGVELQGKGEIQRLAAGLLSRVFKLYDPMEKAKELTEIENAKEEAKEKAKRKKWSFLDSMNKILSRWQSECERVPSTKPRNENTDVGRILTQIGRDPDMLRYAVKATLKSQNQARYVYFAANSSANAIYELFKNNFWDKSIVNAMLENLRSLSKDRLLPNKLENIEEGSLTQKILHSETFDKWDYLAHDPEEVSALHIAALTGNIDAVKKIIKYGDSLVGEDYQKRKPYIYGLIHCEMNGVNIDLLLALLDSTEINQKEVRGNMLSITPGLHEEIEDSRDLVEKRARLLAKFGSKVSPSFKSEFFQSRMTNTLRIELINLLGLEPLGDAEQVIYRHPS